MSEQDKQEAREHAARAARQTKHAARNAGRATAEGVEYAAEEVIDTSRQAVKRIRPFGLAAISSDVGIGFLALSVTLYAGAVTVYKFRSAINGRGRGVN